MEDKEMIGKLGDIDTEYERSKLEYKPSVRYEPKRPFTVNLETETVIGDPKKELIENDFSNVSKPTEQYIEFANLLTSLTKTINKLRDTLKGLEFPISKEQNEKLMNSNPSLLYSSAIPQTGLIDFDMYDSTFNDPENPANSLIQDIVHSYAEDVEGRLDLELYEDLREMETTLKEGYFLYREAILKNILSDNIPESPEMDNEFIKRMEESVKKQEEEYKHITQTYDGAQGSYYESLRTEYGTPEFFKQNEKYLSAKRVYDLSLRKNNTSGEMIELLDGLLIGTGSLLGSIKTGLVIGSDIEEKEVISALSANQASTKEDQVEIMKLTQLALKLQVNQQIEAKKQYRDVLKNINNLSRKKRAHDELLTAFELRNKMYLKLYDSMEHLNLPDKDLGTETFLNQVAGGLSLIQNQYESFMKDIYGMYVSEHEIRSEKVNLALEKENARTGYSLVLKQL